MEEAQALLLRNFRVGKGNPSACAQWLTEMARDLLAPIMPHEIPGVFHMLLRRGRGFGLSDLEENGQCCWPQAIGE